jgi:hypothetical protein
MRFPRRSAGGGIVVALRLKGSRVREKDPRTLSERDRETESWREEKKTKTFWIHCREGLLPPRGRSEIDVQWWT